MRWPPEWALPFSSSFRRRVATGQARFDGRRARWLAGKGGSVWLSPAGGRRADRWRREAAEEKKTRLGADGGGEVLHRPRLRSLCLLLDGRLAAARWWNDGEETSAAGENDGGRRSTAASGGARLMERQGG
ncbi:hypothetical protein A7C99_1103 [Trichophyton rubrum]|uniref:Uncharacterized protein n=1 Tax=Trichophyton rubrum TaxID=5551 RepID=A0A178F6A3_TRIRU|nr:hypothetical protein A7C99_1103 [Trichophyton rubrum]